MVRRLSVAGAAKLATIKKNKGLSSEIVNRKMTRSYPVSRSFFEGATVAKRFEGGWCLGRVDKTYQDEDEPLWHVTYSDFDGEDMTKSELAKCLVYHPALQQDYKAEELKVGTFVWFSEEQQPRLGEVVSVDASSPRPITVKLYEPQANAVSLPRARFVKAREADSDATKVTQITMHQVVLRLQHLTVRGYLQAADRRRLQRCLT